MAGSYNSIINGDGNLRDNMALVDSLETGGDVYECVEELYGMIWFLAHMGAAPHVAIDDFHSLQYARENVKDIVEIARSSYLRGLEIAKEVNK